MAFDPRRLSIIQVAALVTIVVSLAVIAFFGFSIWAETMKVEVRQGWAAFLGKLRDENISGKREFFSR
jgi:type IV secretory pathway TrbD component